MEISSQILTRLRCRFPSSYSGRRLSGGASIRSRQHSAVLIARLVAPLGACCGHRHHRHRSHALPITFGLPPVGALIMLAGIYYGAQYGARPRRSWSHSG